MNPKPKRVAIVGCAYRLPGGAPGEFWPALLAGRDLVTQVPADRWSQDPYWHPQKSHPGTSYTFAAGTIGDITGFDAEFFGISPREAAQIDPQQRLLLELGWEALENAGIRAADLRGSNCGVFVGISSVDYSFRFVEDLAAAEPAAATGTANSIAANRVSYALDLRGPSISVDTACSSSLIAFHLACRSITSGECDLALTGGVSLHMHPYGFVTFSKASMLSRQGRCKVFDASGDGYVRSEGAGVFLLKDLDRALADGDRIIAVVAGTATNSDGRNSGLTVPSVEAQAALLEQAYAGACISPAEIDYVEAHGTGTAVGDPVETHALGLALGRHRSRDNPLLIGSVKSNIGHLEAASGAAGLIKALHCIEARTLPATIHLRTPNPNIRFDEWNLRVPVKPTPLKPEGRLVIGVNSFGFGGANAHVILESPPPARRPDPPASDLLPVLLSAKSAAALRQLARQWAAYARAPDNPASLYDLAWHASMRRDWHEHRAVCIVRDKAALADALDALAAGNSADPVETGQLLERDAPVAFVYSGNGSQWEGMGRELLQVPAFRSAVEQVDSHFRPLAGYSLVDELAGNNGAGRYALTEIAQPALFALQIGITAMLRERGLRPAAVAGHSVGEVAAAWACGALTLEQAVRVIFHRSRSQARTRGQGGMSAVSLGREEIVELLAALGLAGRIAVAGVNSARAVTVAAPVAELERLEQTLRERRIAFRRLDLDYAFHSAAMDPVRQEIANALAGLQPGAAAVPFHSSVSGIPVEGAALGADYWWRNIREPVLFEAAVNSLLSAGTRVFIEIGPHAILRGYITQCLRERAAPGRVVATQTRDDGSILRVWRALACAAIDGNGVDWRAWLPVPGHPVTPPGYPWQRERHWHGQSAVSTSRLQRRKMHPLLGYRADPAEWLWENELDTRICPSLADHVVGDTVVMPGTGFLEMALAAAHAWRPVGTVEIERLDIRTPLVFANGQPKRLRLHIDPSDGSFTIRSRGLVPEDEWVLHAAGRISGESSGLHLRQVLPALTTRIPDFDGAYHDAMTRAAGLAYGPAYRAISDIWVEGASAYARFHEPAAIAAELDSTRIHPALLDCAFQLIIELMQDDSRVQAGCVYVPTRVEELVWRPGCGQPQIAHATLLKRSPHMLTARFTLFDGQGNAIASIREVRFTSLRTRKGPRDRLRFLDYRYVALPHPRSAPYAAHRLFERLQAGLPLTPTGGKSAAPSSRYATEVEPLLDVLCSGFAARALRALAAGGPILTEASLRSCVAATPAIAPLLAHLLAMLREDQILVAEGSDWRFSGSDDLPAPEDIWNSLIRDYPDYLPVIHCVGRVGMHLADLLQGRRSPDQVLPRNSSLGTLAQQVLAEAGLPRLREAVAEAVGQALREAPAGARLRVLEVCASKPLFAETVCRQIDFDRCSYRVTAFAPAAAEECHRLKEDIPALELGANPLRTTDTAAIPACEQFQLALVSSDFESEDSALLALAHARRMLAPGGTLVMVDQQPCRWMDMVLGARASWWSENAASETWRSRHRSPNFWRRRAQKAQLADVAVFDLTGEIGAGPFLLLAHAADTAEKPAETAGEAHTWLLLADRDSGAYSSRLAGQLRRVLQARGDRVVIATPASRYAVAAGDNCQLDFGDDAQFEALLAHAAARTGRIDGIVHLQGLAGNSEDAPPLLQFERQANRCASAAALFRACEATALRPACWLLTAGVTANRQPDADSRLPGLLSGMDAAFWGFGRTAANELPEIALRLADIDNRCPLDTLAFVLAREFSYPDAEREIVFNRGGERLVPRLRRLPPPAPKAEPPLPAGPEVLRLAFDIPGQLRNLRWESVPALPREDDELEIEVKATGLNFRDVMYTLGLLSEDAIENGFAGPSLGLEFSGVIVAAGARARDLRPGTRVFGFGAHSFSNRVRVRRGHVAPVPDLMSYEAAATIPSTFLTAHYSLNHLARLEHGEKVLIHGAAGGVGIAAIQLAQRCGAEIFATAGTPEKRDFLRLMGVEHVMDSRSLKFAEDILALTDGEGVDVVLNSLAGEAINRNLRVLRPLGRFIELGKRDFQENTRIGLRPFRNNISYFAVDADQLMKERPEFSARLFQELMAMFDEGLLHPLPYRAFEAGEVVDAFRCMQQSRHIGKIVVTYRNGIPAARRAETAPLRLELPHDASYLVTGGLDGFGLRTAEWLAARGARNLVLISRSGRTAPAAAAALAALEGAGVRIHAAACDVTDPAALSRLFSEIAATLPPLRGIVHAAAVIEDATIRNLDAGRLRRVLAPKVLGAHYLHELTRERPLDFFLLYSSATTLFGNPGQAAYVAANGYLDAYAAALRAAGRRAFSVRWGAIADAGFLARNQDTRDALVRRMGGNALPAAVAFDVLEQLLLANQSGCGVLEFDWAALKRFLPAAASPRFSEIADGDTEGAGADDGRGHRDMDALLATLPPAELAAAVTSMLKKEIGEILRVAPEKIDDHRLLHDMGFDSLMGVELSTAVENRFAVRLPVMALSDSPTASRLAAAVLERLAASDQRKPAADTAEVIEQGLQLAARHGGDDYAEALARTAGELQAGTAADPPKIIH